MADTPLTQTQLDAMEQSYVDMNKALLSMFANTKKLNGQNQSNLKVNESMRTLAKEMLANDYKALEIAEQFGAITKDQLAMEKQKLRYITDEVQGLMQQRSEIEHISAAFDRTLQKRRQDVELLKAQGKLIKANALEFAHGFMNKESGGAGNNAASAMGRAGQVANDPKQILAALGPWGQVVEMIADVVDGVRLLGADLHKASAESGSFSASVKRSGDESLALYNSQFTLQTKQGLTVKEAAQIYTDLKSTGIEALGVINETSSGLTKMAEDVMTFAKNTGQSTAEVASQYALLVRDFGKNSRDAESLRATYGKVFMTSQKLAHEEIGSMTEIMKMTFSLADSFKDVGMSVEGVNKVVEAVGDSMKELQMAGGIDRLQKIASGILGIRNASEGWQVLMAKMSGVGGGFAQALFKFQQRGANNLNPKADTYDPMQQIAMYKNTINQMTGGIADSATRQFLTEQIGGQMGLDNGTVQVLQNMKTGKKGESDAAKQMKAMHDAAVQNNLDSKGMFDILRNILLGMIAKPIILIWKLIASWRHDTQSGLEANKMSKNLDKAIKGSAAAGPQDRDAVGLLKGGHAIGADVTRSGLMMVHAGNRIMPVATAKPYGGTGGGSGLNLTFNMNIDEKNITKQFRDMERKTLDLMHKQQKANFG